MTATASNQNPLADQASFVFKGTVKKLKAATMSDVPVTNRTAIVHVDEVLQAPKLLLRSEGTDITVKLNQVEKLKAGTQVVFYTNPWRYGDSVAVESTGHTEVADSPAAAFAAPSPLQARKNRDLQEHLQDADVVVKGRVVSVGLPEKTAKASKTKPAKDTATTRVSEHSAKWNEAIVEVESVEKGRKLQKRIAIQFPRSEDVAWQRAPKLDPGQEGIFLLHKTKAPAKQRTGAAKKRNLQSYAVLHHHDFLPADKASDVRTLLQSKASTRSSKG